MSDDLKELKPCPFCGGMRHGFATEPSADDVGRYIRLQCQGCDAGTISIHYYEDDPKIRQELRERWNRRAPNVELEQAKADAARYKKEARTYQQIQRACGDLPDGWEIHICLEKDAGWVDLISPDGERTAVDTDHDDISYSIGDAIDAALKSQEVKS